MSEIACARCERGLPATHFATSEVLALPVCALCVLDALDLPAVPGADDVIIRPLGQEIDPEVARG